MALKRALGLKGFKQSLVNFASQGVRDPGLCLAFETSKQSVPTCKH